MPSSKLGAVRRQKRRYIEGCGMRRQQRRYIEDCGMRRQQRRQVQYCCVRRQKRRNIETGESRTGECTARCQSD